MSDDVADYGEGALGLAEWAYDKGITAEPTLEFEPDDKVAKVIIPQRYQLADVNLDQYRPQPRRKKGAFAFTQVASFCTYLNAHKGSGTQVFIDRAEARFSAQINGHATISPGWADHTAEFLLLPTDAWAAWLAKNGRSMTQQEFAEFLEDRLSEIAEPSGAELMEAATNLKLYISANFDSKVALANGRINFSYTESLNDGNGTAGQLRLPEELSIVVQPYEGSSIATVKARLRWRFDRNVGKVSFWYTLGIAPQEIRDEKIDEAFTEVAAAVPDVPLLYGSVIE